MHSFYEVSRNFKFGKFCLTTVDTIFREDEFRGYIKAFEADDSVDGYMAVTSFIDDEKPLYIDVDEPSMRITAFRDAPWDGVRYISGGISRPHRSRSRSLLSVVWIRVSPVCAIISAFSLKAASFLRLTLLIKL